MSKTTDQRFEQLQEFYNDIAREEAAWKTHSATSAYTRKLLDTAQRASILGFTFVVYGDKLVVNSAPAELECIAGQEWALYFIANTWKFALEYSPEAEHYLNVFAECLDTAVGKAQQFNQQLKFWTKVVERASNLETKTAFN